jgi:hypothetical protein
VAVPDLGSWSRLVGSATGLLRMLGAVVDRGGWMYAGFSNALFPAHLLARGSLRPWAVRRCLDPSGSWTVERFIPMPDQRCPAYLVPVTRRQEMDFFLRRLFIPFTGAADGRDPALVRRGLSAMRSLALLTPPRARTYLAPAMAVVARRIP